MPDISFSPDDSLCRDRDRLSEESTSEEIVGLVETSDRISASLA